MKLKGWIVAVVVVAVGGVGGFVYWQQQIASRLPEGLAAGNGRIEADQVDISTKIAGRVQEISVEEGDMVKVDQVVAQIDTAELDAQLRRAEADVAQAESAVAAAETVIVQRQSELRLATQNLERTAKLVSRGFDTKERLEQRMTSMETARAALDAAQASSTSAKRSVEAAEAERARIQTQIADCTLTSPVSGRVLYRLTEPGEVLGTGGKVVTLVNLDDIYMEIFLPSAQAHLVSIGSEARIKLDVLDVAIPAKVSFVSPQSQFTPKQVETPSEREKLMFRVKVRVPQDLVARYIDQVKTGIRGVAYVPLGIDTKPDWPDFLQNLPPDPAAQAVETN
ncbi:HlyD family secretion protein [Hoeflea sp. TYP-13]|uniref:HlyD family secretion protein n=1 Tax=Hoeflea sp. TYP-13 TaxID=3230023 RepID=UPI0034C5D4E1